MTKLEQVARAIFPDIDPPTPYSLNAARAAVGALRDDAALPEFPEWNAHLNAILSEKPE